MAYNILIVDDMSIMRQVMKMTVQISGVDLGEVYEAGNGIEALEQVREHWVDLIITDLNMPEMGGIELIESLKEDEVLASIPIIVVSIEGRDSVVNHALELGSKGVGL
jgi:two-component system chemotaxis response regulator CheY